LAALLLLLSVIGCAEKPPAPREEVTGVPIKEEPAAKSAPPALIPAGETSTPAAEKVTIEKSAPEKTAPEAAPAKPVAAPELPGLVAEPASASPEPAATVGTKLISRQVLFGNPDKSSARLSPDGTKLSYLAPHEGVMNLFVGPVDDPSAAKPVTHEKDRGVRSYFWAYDNQHLLYPQDKKGDEDWHIYSVDLTSGETKDLTPYDKVAAQVDGVSDKIPQDIVVGINDRDPQLHDLYRVNLQSGERTLLEKNEGFVGYVVDDDYKVRFASKMTPDGGIQYYEPNGEGGWKEFLKVGVEDTLTTNLAGFDKTGKKLYLTDSRGRNTSALAERDLETGKETVLAANDKADVGAVLSHPTEKTIQAVSFDYEKPEWQILDPAVAEDLKYLQSVSPGDVQIPSRTLDDKR